MFLGVVAAIILLVLAANSSDRRQMLMGCYTLFAFSILAGGFLIRSGVIYLNGSPIYRAEKPAQFWFVVIFATLPPLFISGWAITLHILSLFGG